MRTLPPDGTLIACSTAHPTDPGRLPLPCSVLGLLRTQGRTLPRDGGQIHKLANHVAVDRWHHRPHQQLTSLVRDRRDARRARIGQGVHLYRDKGFPAQIWRTPPPIIGDLHSQQLSRRDWSEDDETTHHQQHRSKGRTGH